MKMHGYIGRCPRKGCQHTERKGLGSSFGRCPQHGSYSLKPLWGALSDGKCNAACVNAHGPSCDCSCGGVNHGLSHSLDAAQLAIAPDASIVEESVQAPVPRHEAMALFTPAPTQLDGQLAF
jgi:hypothetical protein